MRAVSRKRGLGSTVNPDRESETVRPDSAAFTFLLSNEQTGLNCSDFYSLRCDAYEFRDQTSRP